MSSNRIKIQLILEKNVLNIDDDDILFIKVFKFIQWIHWQLTIAN